MGWKSVRGGEKGFDHDLTGWKLNGKHAHDRLRRSATRRKNKAGPQDLHGHRHAVRLVGLPQRRPAAQVRAQGHARVRALPQRERVEAARSGSLQFNHDDRKDAGDADPRHRTRDVACSKCHPKARVQPAGREARQLRQQRLPPERRTTATCSASATASGATRRRSSRSSSVREDMPFFDHTERTRFDLGRAQQAQVLRLPHQGARRGQADRRVRAVPRQGQQARRSVQRSSASPPTCGDLPPDERLEAAERVQPRHADEVQADRKHARGRVPRVPPRQGPGGLRALRTSITGKPTDCMGCHEHKNVHDEQVQRTASAREQCLRLPRATPATSRSSTSKLVERLSRRRSRTFPLVKGHKDVPCADCHTGRKRKGKTTFDKIPPSCSASAQVPRGLAPQGHARRQVRRVPLPGHVGRAQASITTSRSPTTHKGEVDELPAQGRAQEQQVRVVPPDARLRRHAETTCAAEGCHAEDDAHKGRLGNKCEQCHVETGDNIFNHNTMSTFQLDGKHLEVRCADCHPSVTFKPRPTTASAVTPSRRCTRASTAPRCEQCHTTRTWEDIKPLHDVGDFSLKGAHDNIACERCHRDNRPLAGSGNLCINCHRQDDIHSTRCRRAAASATRSGRSRRRGSITAAVGCNLTGLHRTIACFDCHQNGNFAAIAPQCVELPPRRRARASATRRHRPRAPDRPARAATTRTRGCRRGNVQRSAGSRCVAEARARARRSARALRPRRPAWAQGRGRRGGGGRRARTRTSDDGGRGRGRAGDEERRAKKPKAKQTTRSRSSSRTSAATTSARPRRRTSSRRTGSSSTRSTPRRPRRARWSRAACRRARSSYTESGGSYRRDGLGRQQRAVLAAVHRAPAADRLPPHRRRAGGTRASTPARALVNTPERRQRRPAARRPIRPAIQSGFNGTQRVRPPRAVAVPQRQAQRPLLRPPVRPRPRRVKFDGLRVDYAKLAQAHAHRLRRPVSAPRLALDHHRLRRAQGPTSGNARGPVRRRRAASAAPTARTTRTARSAASRSYRSRASSRASSRPRPATAAAARRSTSTTSRSSICSASQGAGLTNLSAGVNYKPSPRLRLTASFNRVDVETLTSRRTRSSPSPTSTASAPRSSRTRRYFRRLATNVGARRHLGGPRPAPAVRGHDRSPRTATARRLAPDRATGMIERRPRSARPGVEVYVSITDRRSIKDLRLGVDVSRIVRRRRTSRSSAARSSRSAGSWRAS